MKIICKWFHEDERVIGQKPGKGKSYGVCPECKEKLEREAEETILRYRIRRQEIEAAHSPGRLNP
jgi:uncharacterized CHY-type Zn-finger protein